MKDHTDAPPHFHRIDICLHKYSGLESDFTLDTGNETRSFMRLKQRNTVLLPQPEGPIMAVILRSSIVQIDIAHGMKIAIIDIELFCLNC